MILDCLSLHTTYVSAVAVTGFFRMAARVCWMHVNFSLVPRPSFSMLHTEKHEDLLCKIMCVMFRVKGSWKGDYRVCVTILAYPIQCYTHNTDLDSYPWFFGVWHNIFCWLRRSWEFTHHCTFQTSITTAGPITESAGSIRGGLDSLII